ncbi:MAG TPA: helix-turn-helix domain-containing protein [Frankiaceae bacterium]|nr:helix-turn-helix domain-containing protein [Frankiaceae bacterium]
MASIERLGRVFGVFDDATRRRVYDAVVSRRGPTSRDQVAEDVGISRTLAAFHLDKLSDRGLLTVSYARLTGRQGPGAGRPAKLYERSDLEIDASLPERRYDLAGQILAAAVAATPRGGSAKDAAMRIAHERGVEAGAAHEGRKPRGARGTLTAACEVAAGLGYEPEATADEVTLLNCPFHAVMTTAPDLVCAMNTALLDGVVAGVRGSGVVAELDPAEGRCCVVLRRA